MNDFLQYLTQDISSIQTSKMAIEKLILRSVMYGADKIPDKWFDAVPGGYYKAKDKIEGKDSGDKHRKHDDRKDAGRRGRRDHHDDGYRSEGGKRYERRARSSYDGNDDEDRRSGRGRRRETESDAKRPNVEGRRRRHSVDSERPEQGVEQEKMSRNAYYGGHRMHDAKRKPPRDPYFDEHGRPVTSESERTGHPSSSNPDANANAEATADPSYAATRSGSVTSPQMSSPQVHSPRITESEQPRGASKNGYVPYEHLYGSPAPGSQQRFPPPPTSSKGPVRSNGFPPPPPGPPRPSSYQQNPLAQQAPTAADAGAGAFYTGQPGIIPRGTWPNRSAAARDEYEEHSPSYPTSSTSSRYLSSRHDYSSSYDRRDPPASSTGRTHSERRADAGKGKDRGMRLEDPLLIPFRKLTDS